MLVDARQTDPQVDLTRHVQRLVGLRGEELRQRLDDLRQTLSLRGAELAERRRRLVERGRQAAAGTRGFIEGLRRGGNGDEAVRSELDVESNQDVRESGT